MMLLIKRILLVFLLIVSVAHAGVSKEDAISVLKGKYRISFEGYTSYFLIRSTGKIQLLTEESELEQGELYFISTSGVDDHSGLPVAHLVFGLGSDEDTLNAHVLLVVDKDWGVGTELKKIGSFTTFNDGPNDLGSTSQNNVKLEKYDSKSKKYITL